MTAAVLNSAGFEQLFLDFRSSARRLEPRSRYYSEPEQEGIAIFNAGRETMERRRQAQTRWGAVVRGATARGARFERVRVVSDPPTDYQRFGMYGSQVNTELGEDMRYLPRDRANELDLPGHDFWVFDSEKVAFLPWTADDRMLEVQLITDPELVAHHERWIDLAWPHATPALDYIAEDPTRIEPPGRVASRST